MYKIKHAACSLSLNPLNPLISQQLRGVYLSLVLLDVHRSIANKAFCMQVTGDNFINHPCCVVMHINVYGIVLNIQLNNEFAFDVKVNTDACPNKPLIKI
jgi:hypothetical protein